MKKASLISAVALCATTFLPPLCERTEMVLQAQNVSIAATPTNPDPTAGLDIIFNDRSLLIPRVNLTSLTSGAPIVGGTPAQWLLVFNTNTTLGVGYYYWDGSKWVKSLASITPSDAWLTKGNAGTTAGTHFLGTTDNVDMVFKTNNTERMRITNTGNIGIGTTNPGSYKLYVNGAAYSIGGWQSSDLRYKKNIEDIENALNKILKIRGIRFEWNKEKDPNKNFPEGKHYGVIAQEIEKVLPEVVKTEPDGEKTVSYQELVPILIEAIKEQQKQINELKMKLSEKYENNKPLSTSSQIYNH